MIVKVQLSLATTDAHRQVLIYDEDHDFEVQCAAPPAVVKLLKGRAKAFFEAHFEPTDGLIVLDEEVEDQPW